MSDALESLVPEVYDCLSSGLNLKALLAMRQVSPVWQDRIDKTASAWQSCCEARFGSEAAGDAHHIGDFKRLRNEENETLSTWCKASLEPESRFVFSSYVRSWASDDLLLVAGLYDGSLQPVNWETGSVKRRFQERHQDEVVCIDLNEKYILSGSGDPGYYQRPTMDASVKLWSRDGKLLGSLNHHRESVRGCVLLPSTSALNGFGLSACLGSNVVLMSLDPFQPVASEVLPGGCRSLCIVRPRWRPLLGSEVRVLASAGECIVELAVTRSSSGSAPTLSSLRQINLQFTPISGMTCYASPILWERALPGSEYPTALLDEEGLVVAGGTCSGGLWMFYPSDRDGRSLRTRLSGEFGGSNEVVSVELLSSKVMLAMSRSGRMCLAEAEGELRIKWAVAGFRMYVSTIARRQPLLLVSDGFDNAIRTLRVVRDAAPDDSDD